MPQKALIVRTTPDGHDGLTELNVELERGWRVAEMTPMGGAGGATESPCHAALVILEHQDSDPSGPSVAAQTLEEVEEEAEKAVEEAAQGNGTEPGPPESPSS